MRGSIAITDISDVLTELVQAEANLGDDGAEVSPCRCRGMFCPKRQGVALWDNEGDGGRWEGDGGRWEGDGGRWEGDGGRWEGDGGRWEGDGGDGRVMGEMGGG